MSVIWGFCNYLKKYEVDRKPSIYILKDSKIDLTREKIVKAFSVFGGKIIR